jgi:RNA polymerase sigma factor (TIGR02999 family)
MTEVTRILSAIEKGDPHAAEQLLPLVYDELRKLAAHKLAQEKPGQTLDATALVHEAYLRLFAEEPDAQARANWANRRHFFAAAAQAMRRILIESARRKQLAPRVDFEGLHLAASGSDERLLELHDALDRLPINGLHCACEFYTHSPIHSPTWIALRLRVLHTLTHTQPHMDCIAPASFTHTCCRITHAELELDDRKQCDLHWIVAWNLHRIVAYRKPMRRHTCYFL